MTPAVTPQPEKMSMDDFANSIKAKYPGAYDHIDNEELADKVLTKYPVYRQHVDIKPAPQAEEPAWKQNPAVRFFNAVGSSIIDAPKAIYHAATDPLTQEEEKDFQGHIRIPGEVFAERMTGRPIVSAAKAYASGQVTPKGAMSVLPEALGSGVGNAIIPELTHGAWSGARAIAPTMEGKPIATAPIRYAARATESALNQKLLPVRPLLRINTPADAAEAIQVKVPGRDLGIPKPSQAEGLPEVEAAQPETVQHLKRVVADDAAMRAEAAKKLPRSEGTEEMEALRPETEAKLRSVLSANKARAIDTTKMKLGDLLNNATGGKPLAKGVPIRQQLDTVTPVPKESSVIKSHSYDPNAREMTITTQNGSTYVHGDVTPDQAEAFANAESKGKAWNELRNNSTLVGKVVGGKRIAIKPSGPKTASPNDLTQILKDSVRAAKAIKPSEKK